MKKELFQSSSQALQFTFSVLGRPIIKISSINSMRGSSNHGDLTPYEQHAQAAMILACVERRVDIYEISYLKAYYGKELIKGQHERQVADILVRAVISTLGTGMHRRRGIEKLVRIFFGQDIPMSAVRHDLGCNPSFLNQRRDQVYDVLSDIGNRAETNADVALHVAGLID